MPGPANIWFLDDNSNNNSNNTITRATPVRFNIIILYNNNNTGALCVYIYIRRCARAFMYTAVGCRECPALTYFIFPHACYRLYDVHARNRHDYPAVRTYLTRQDDAPAQGTRKGYFLRLLQSSPKHVLIVLHIMGC